MANKIFFKTVEGKYVSLDKASNPEDKVRKVMGEFKRGTLHSSSGQKVTSKDQALAIAMSESGLSKQMVADILIDYDDMEKASQIKEGIKVEKEHIPTMKYIKDKFGKYHKMANTEDIAEHIAGDHLEEIKDYYTRLLEMEKQAKGDKKRPQIEIDVIKFLIDNPNPADSKVHTFSDKIGIDTHKLEAIFYKLATERAEMSKDMQKAKSAIGTTATWADGKQYRKVAEGQWEQVKGDGKSHNAKLGGGAHGYGKHDVSTAPKLHKRFMDYLQNMSQEHRDIFRGGKFDFEKKTFTAIGGKVALLWKDDKVNIVKTDKMDKARVTKYIKRVPKPSGKGYYYFYTKQQFNQYKETGKVPEQEKGDSALQKIFKFLGVDNWMDGSKKIGSIYESNKSSLLENNVDKKTFAEYSVEYLSNKEKWDSRLSGEKKEKSESKPKSEQPKSEKKESGDKKEGKWNMGVMRAIAGIYGSGEIKKIDTEMPMPTTPNKKDDKNKKDKEAPKKGFEDELNEREKEGNNKTYTNKIKQLQNEINSFSKTASGGSKYSLDSKGNEDSGEMSIQLKDSVSGKIIPNTQITGKIKDFLNIKNQLIEKMKEIDSNDKSPDNFDTMPEGDDIEKGIEDYYKKITEEFSNEKPDLNKIKKVAKEKADKINSIMNKEISLDTGGIVKSNKKFILEKYDPKEDKMTFKDNNGKTQEITFSKFEKENPKFFNSQKPSATEALKTFTIVDNNNPERTVKVQAKDENEAKDKGASELKTTNIRTYESSNKVEALKDELGKKKSESREREITVFGKQQKVKTKPIELNLGYGHPFEIAKREFGSGRSDWIILESSTGLKVGDGKTQKEAISNAESMIKNYTPTENEFKKLIEKSLSSENVLKREKEIEKNKEIDKKVEKDFEDKSEKGQSQIKKNEEDDKRKQVQKDKLNSSDPQKKYDAMKEEIRDFSERNNISEKEITKEWINEERKRFQQDIKDAYKYKKPKEAGVYKVGLKELDNIEKYQKEMISLKEELLGPKMFKALSNLREELMFKAQTTKYIKRIPDPKGKGYIYFYTQDQVKAYQKDGTIPNQQKKPKTKPEQGGKTNIEKLKETTKKIATIVADALSAKDAVNPAGQAVEQAGEDINEKNKMKKRLEEKQVPDKKKQVNKPEEKPKK